MQYQIPINAAEKLQKLQYQLDDLLRCDVRSNGGLALYQERSEQFYHDLFNEATWLIPLARAGLRQAKLVIEREEPVDPRAITDPWWREFDKGTATEQNSGDAERGGTDG